MGRVLAVDWGKRRVGLAISDETRTICRPLPTAPGTSTRKLVTRIESIVQEEGVDTVVVGHPIGMGGGAGPSADSARKLSDAIQGRLPEIRVLLWDERLTTREAVHLLHKKGERVRKRSGRIDQVAAAVLLQAYLDSEIP